MPREIIDTQSSRPRYVRRIALTAAVAVIVFALVLVAIFMATGHWAHAPVPGK
jgi:hypothetical protein